MQRFFAITFSVLLTPVVFSPAAYSQSDDRVQVTENVTVPASKGGCPFSYASVFEGEKPTDLVGFIAYAWKALRGRTLVVIPHYDCLPEIESLELRQSDRSQEANDNELVFETGSRIEVIVQAFDREGNFLVYEYQVSGGKVEGKGSKVIWDLGGLKLGTYSITVCVYEGYGCDVKKTKTIRIDRGNLPTAR